MIYFWPAYAKLSRKLCWNESRRKTCTSESNSVLTHQIIFFIRINCSVLLRMGVFACWLWRCFVAAEYLNFFAPICLFVYYYVIFQQQHWLLCHNNIILNLTSWLLSKWPDWLLRCSVAMFCLVKIKSLSLSFCTTTYIIPNRIDWCVHCRG